MFEGLHEVSLTFSSELNARKARNDIYQIVGVGGNRTGTVLTYSGEVVAKVKEILTNGLENTTPDY